MVQPMPGVAIRLLTEAIAGLCSVAHQPRGSFRVHTPRPACCTHAPSLLTLGPSQDKETSHRVIVGRDYYEPQGIDPQVRRSWAEWWLWVQLRLVLLVVACAACTARRGWRHGSSADGGSSPLTLPWRSSPNAALAPLLPQTTVERVFAFLLRKKVPRQTEGEP